MRTEKYLYPLAGKRFDGCSGFSKKGNRQSGYMSSFRRHYT